MNKSYPLAELKQRLEGASKILIVLPQRPFFDQVAAALSFSLALEEVGKNASVVCTTPMTVEFNHLVGVDKVTDKIRGTDMIISLNYPVEQIEKVSYNDDNNRPNVVIQPKPGALSLTENLAMFSYAGVEADLIVTVGLKDLSRLGVSDLNPSGSFLVNLDIDSNNTQFGQLNIVDYEAACLCEVVLNLILGLNFPLAVDTAQNLLSGIWRQTRGLTNNLVGADTYEAVALCLRTGAQKPLPENERPPNLPRREEVFTPKKFEPREEKRSFSPRPAEPPKAQPEAKPAIPTEEPKGQPPVKPPADWFEPKIFKGTSFS